MKSKPQKSDEQKQSEQYKDNGLKNPPKPQTKTNKKLNQNGQKIRLQINVLISLCKNVV